MVKISVGLDIFGQNIFDQEQIWPGPDLTQKIIWTRYTQPKMITPRKLLGHIILKQK